MGRTRGRPRAVARGRGRGRGRMASKHQSNVSSEEEIDERQAEELEILAMESGLNGGEETEIEDEESAKREDVSTKLRNHQMAQFQFLIRLRING